MSMLQTAVLLVPALLVGFALTAGASADRSPGDWQTFAGGPLPSGDTFMHEDVRFDSPVAAEPTSFDASRGGEAFLVGTRAGSLHVLHTMRPGPAATGFAERSAHAKEVGDAPPEPMPLFAYRVTYADGETIDIPVRWGESIHDRDRDGFWSMRYGMTGHLAWADIAAMRTVDPIAGQVEVLYAMRWPNPRPDVVVESVTPVAGIEGAGTVEVYGVVAGGPLHAGPVKYVAPDGDDGNPGTFDEPLADPVRAIESLEPGETLYLRGGRYGLTRRVNVSLKGTESKPIVISGYPGETPVLDATDWTFSDDPEIAGHVDSPFRRRLGFLHFNDSTYLTVRAIRLENLISMGMSVQNTDHVVVEHNTVYLAPASAIYLTGTHGRADHNTVIRGCSLLAFEQHLAHDPSRLEDPILMAQKEYLDNRRGRGGFGDETIMVGGSGSSDLSAGFNEVAWSDKEGINSKGGPTRVRLHHNYVHNNHFWTALYADNWSRPMSDIELDHNVVRNNFGIGIQFCVESGPGARNIRIHHNLSFDNGLTGIEIGKAGRDGPREDIVVAFNTVVNNGFADWNRNPSGGILVSSRNVEDVRVEGNLVVGSRDYGTAAFGPDYAEMDVRFLDNAVFPMLPVGFVSDQDRAWNVPGTDDVGSEFEFVDPENHNYRLRTPAPVGLFRTGK
jgi:hypothetical protein